MRLRGSNSVGKLARLALLALPVAACGRDRPDVREPLGAPLSGRGRAALAGRAGGGVAAPVPSTAALPPATYTGEQAARGASVYEATCARCHPPGQLDGERFAAGWNDARAWTLLATVRNTMPQDRPGTLTDDESLAVVAYLLQRNRVAPGARPLPSDSAALHGLRIAVAPQTAAPVAAAGR